jgi:outer membrane protein
MKVNALSSDGLLFSASRRCGATWLRPLLALALLAGMATTLRAQSLSDVFEMARTYDATYQAARAQAEAAEYNAAQAESLALPSVNANASVLSSQIDLPQGRSGDNNAIQGRITGRYPLFNRANDATIAQARRSLQAAKAALLLSEQDLIIRVTQAYFDVLAAQDTAQLTRVSKTAILEQLASAKRNFEVGTATITDAREAQARADLATAQEIAADIELRNRRIVLGTLVGRRDIEPDVLVSPVVLPPVVPDDIEEWVRTADTVHPSVTRAQVAFDIAKLEIDKARAGFLPTVDAVATAALNNASGDSIIPGTTTRSGTVGVELNWPLYTGGFVSNRVKEAVALEQRSRDELDNARRTVALNTRVAFSTVLSGEALVKALEAAESSSRLSLQATELGYKVGVRVNIDVLNAQTQLFQTQRDLFRARYDVLVGSLRLRQASGQLAPLNLLSVDSLLRR